MFEQTFKNIDDILHKDAGVCLRATYIVDPQGIVRWVSVNDLSVGRSVGLESGRAAMNASKPRGAPKLVVRRKAIQSSAGLERSPYGRHAARLDCESHRYAMSYLQRSFVRGFSCLRAAAGSRLGLLPSRCLRSIASTSKVSWFRARQSRRAWPNTSLNRSANGGPPGPGHSAACIILWPGPGVPPSSPG